MVLYPTQNHNQCARATNSITYNYELISFFKYTSRFFTHKNQPFLTLFQKLSIGIHSGMGASHFLPLLLGHAKATEVLLTAKKFTANEAFDIGFYLNVWYKRKRRRRRINLAIFIVVVMKEALDLVGCTTERYY